MHGLWLKQTYIAPYVVDSEISAAHETNESASIHNVGSSNDEVVEVWTCQSYNPVYHSRATNAIKISVRDSLSLSKYKVEDKAYRCIDDSKKSKDVIDNNQC